MSSQSNYYRHSGKVHPSYILFFILGILATVVLSIIYSIGMYYNPSAYLSLIITVVYGLLASKLSVQLAEWGKVRNKIVWAISVLVYFTVFTYVHLAAYAAVVFRYEIRIIDFTLMQDFLWEPAFLLEAFRDYILPQGVWTLGRSGPAVSGIFLLAIWLVEHLAALFLPFYFGHDAISRPFFEETGKWGKETISSLSLKYQPKENFSQLKKAVEQNDINYLRSIKAEETRNGYCQIAYYADPTEERGTRYLTITNVKKTRDRKGGTSTDTHDIVSNLLVSPTFIAELENITLEKDFDL